MKHRMRLTAAGFSLSGLMVALLLAAILAGCASPLMVTYTEDEPGLEVSAGAVDEHRRTPLTRWQWLLRTTAADVPVFNTGTRRSDVEEKLAEWNTRVLREWPDYIAVQSNANMFTGKQLREVFVYGFEDGQIAAGPLTFDELSGKFVEEGMTAGHLWVLQQIALADPTGAGNINSFARLLATMPEESLRRPALAIAYAMQANELADWEEWFYIDTLAAAHAAAGDFFQAARFQRQAINQNFEYDPGMEERLALYQQREVYVESPNAASEDETSPDDAAPEPREELMANAALGDADSQYNLAAFYVTYDIREHDGVNNPGFFWMLEAARNGHELAPNEVGYCLFYGRCGEPIDFERAAYWFERAHEFGDILGSYNLAMIRANGFGGLHDDVSATALYTVAADGGLPGAAFAVAYRYGEGVGADRDGDAMKHYFQLAEEGGYEPSAFVVDDWYFGITDYGSPIGVAIDRMGAGPHDIGDVLLQIAASLADAGANDGATVSITLPAGISASYPANDVPMLRYHLVRIAAQTGLPAAQRQLADFFEQGFVTGVSLPTAQYLRERAERQSGN